MQHGVPEWLAAHTQAESSAAVARREAVPFQRLRRTKRLRHGSVSRMSEGNPTHLGAGDGWWSTLRTRYQGGRAEWTGRKYLEVGRLGRDPAGPATHVL